MQFNPAHHRQVQSFLAAVTHKFTVESDAAVHHTDHVTAITYQQPLAHPWPRAFDYQTEFFAQSRDLANVTQDIQQFFGRRPAEHVLNIFGHETEAITTAMNQLNYRLAWTNVLMGKTLSAESQQNGIRLATSEQDIKAMNQLDPDYPSSTAALADAHLYDYLAENDGLVQGKAQLVTLQGSSTAYVSDMYVFSESRRSGLGSALLKQLHAQAQALGKTETILIPSQMTRQVRFYEKHGYQPVIPMHLFIPAAAQNAKE